jgi:uncharacterized protein YjbI with pentapeptide repeats
MRGCLSWERVNLRGVDLFGANLCEASLKWADLRNATLYYADLSKSVLSGARAEGTDFRNANLTGADFSQVTYDDKTRWPDGFEPEKVGAIRERAPSAPS